MTSTKLRNSMAYFIAYITFNEKYFMICLYINKLNYMFVPLNIITNMKNGNPRGMYNLNRRKEDSSYMVIVLIILTIMLLATFGCTREITNVVDGKGDVYTLTKRGKKVVASKNGVPYRVSYIKK